MNEHIIIDPPRSPIKASIRLPNSKSISNRVLIMAALGGFRHVLQELSDADDTQRLDHLVNECPREMDCGAGGTTLRFLLAWASMQEGEEYSITGTSRLLERPHDELVEALTSLGASIEKHANGYRVLGRKLAGGTVTFRSPVSSQFISALLLIAPYMKEGLEIKWSGEQLSRPYVHMTCGLMRQFGAEVKINDDSIVVEPGEYACDRFIVPRDWSAAAFWYEIVALSPGAQVHLIGLFEDGLQGDAIARRYWQQWVITEMDDEGMMLIHRKPTDRHVEVEFDLIDSPDLFQPLAFTSAALGSPARFSGLTTLPLKETDRLAATVGILKQMGTSTILEDGEFKIPIWQMRPATAADLKVIDPHGDHRMAMAVAPLAVLLPGLRMIDHDVVSKSYPYFWDHLRIAGFTITKATN